MYSTVENLGFRLYYFVYIKMNFKKSRRHYDGYIKYNSYIGGG